MEIIGSGRTLRVGYLSILFLISFPPFSALSFRLLCKLFCSLSRRRHRRRRRCYGSLWVLSRRGFEEDVLMSKTFVHHRVAFTASSLIGEYMSYKDRITNEEVRTKI